MPPRGQTQTFANALPSTREATRWFNSVFGSPRDRPPLPIHFAVADHHLDMPVLEVVFHAITFTSAVDPSGLEILHWRLSAVTQIEYDERTDTFFGSCVGIEVTGEGNRFAATALTVIKSVPYPWTSGAVIYKRLPMGPQGVGITVKTLLQLMLRDWEVHRFQLVERGSGCLHWSTTMIQALVRVGILRQDAIAHCKETVDKARRSGTVAVPRNVRGQFANPFLESFPLAV